MLIEGTFRVPPEDNANGQEQQAAAGTFRIEVNLAGGDPQAPQQHAPAPLPAPAEDVHEPAPEPPADPLPWQPVNLAGNPQAPPQPGAAPLPAPAQNIPFAPDDPIPQPRVFIPPIIFIRRRRRRL